METTSAELIRAISFWGYPVMFLFMVVEGPIATLVSAFLASMGYFDVAVVFALSVTGDIIGDIFWYYLGRYGRQTTIWKIIEFLGINSSVSNHIKKQFQIRGAKIIFTAKSTVGLGIITYILAGASRMNFRKFFLYSFLGGLVWSFLLVSLGYFSGYAADQINFYIKLAGYVILIIVISSILFFSAKVKNRVKNFFNFKI